MWPGAWLVAIPDDFDEPDVPEVVDSIDSRETTDEDAEMDLSLVEVALSGEVDPERGRAGTGTESGGGLGFGVWTGTSLRTIKLKPNPSLERAGAGVVAVAVAIANAGGAYDGSSGEASIVVVLDAVNGEATSPPTDAVVVGDNDNALDLSWRVSVTWGESDGDFTFMIWPCSGISIMGGDM